LIAGVVIPFDFARDLQRGHPTTVQFLLNATNANSAAISQGYAQAVIQNYNARLQSEGVQPTFRRMSDTGQPRGRISLHPAFLYNPGLKDSWFITTGVLGLLLILNSSIVASGAMVKEREAGTIEQLLMSPAGTTEIIVAKIAPLFLLLTMMMFLAIIMIKTVFGVPFHGGLLPVVGVPLPFISYGGTAMVTLMAGFGILMSLCAKRKLVGR